VRLGRVGEGLGLDLAESDNHNRLVRRKSLSVDDIGNEVQPLFPCGLGRRPDQDIEVSIGVSVSNAMQEFGRS